jgi:hypothetical protein
MSVVFNRRCRFSARQPYFLRDSSGSVAMIFGVALPAIAVLGFGALELTLVTSQRAKMQSVADAAALAGAQQLGVASVGAADRAKSFAEAQLHFITAPATATVSAQVMGDSNVKVIIDGYRPSFFGDLLPVGGWRPRAEATAAGLNKAPLCVIGISPTVPNGVHADKGTITATGCVVHSNKDVRINAGSVVNAAILQAVGAVTGAGAGDAQSGAPPIEDPFSPLETGPPNWNSCLSEQKKADQNGQVLELNPGVHCGHFDIDKTATLRLRPGVHYFRDKLQMKESSRLEGDHATVVFGQNLELQIDSNNVRWSIVGSDTGALAGFAFVLDRARTTDLTLPARIIENLEGVVYAPRARLTLNGAANAAEESPWTVFVGEELRLTDNAHMFINSDYAGSSVPVPSGVGNKAAGGGGTRLVE